MVSIDRCEDELLSGRFGYARHDGISGPSRPGRSGHHAQCTDRCRHLHLNSLSWWSPVNCMPRSRALRMGDSHHSEGFSHTIHQAWTTNSGDQHHN